MPKVIRTKCASVELKGIDLFAIFADATGMGDLHDFTVEAVSEDGRVELSGDFRIILNGRYNEPSDGEQRYEPKRLLRNYPEHNASGKKRLLGKEQR